MTATRDDTAVDLDPATSNGARRGLRRALIVTGAVITVLVVMAAVLVFGGERAQQSSEDEARRRLDPSATTAPTGATLGSVLAAAPAPGLYRYEGEGHERTSMPPLTEEQGPSMPATVTAGPDGCWVLQIDLNTHHWQRWTYCTAGNELRERDSTTFSRRQFTGFTIDNTSEITCDPPTLVVAADDRPGTTHERSCTGAGSLLPAPTTVAGRVTIVGAETVDVSGEAIPAIHVRYDLTISGGQTGTQSLDQWLAAATGLLLQMETHMQVGTDTPIGHVTYTEDSRLALQTATPV